ncbi:MAG: putative N-acetylmannosamine-6-phosphate 2-epimerase [candidate division KSB1 bacterium]|nr:putative N-acetylmannosamine-6-phosphate 2-epimerase [candidate division KSB1 bacterium]MDZ7276358.1 putative N-acetylmannosamine-6-phosphate 2-epimerase [candidate division KSB1 bacterium]MDZ7287690.1 putative N-acetylmannosamine-6-phosphate 2-epimerase [candidate division KSB1 bacterium]MDZ7299970.1 putative N-acetylmannosamine-6-phosphate 2-epimerase [candidate division KSB1 bacterium]MDZ7305701.1 putative N-acetylmannosamine-6-phosphate 2-epimerase [candidate division KSB1 bacterium]
MFAALQHGLIVSCQAAGDEPLNRPEYLAALARCAEIGGAVAIRTEGLEKIRAIKAAVKLPVIGLIKGSFADGSVLITPDFADIAAMIDAGADIIALDATDRVRPNGWHGCDFLHAVKQRYRIPLLADVATHAEGVQAAAAGADAVATTLSGYTPATAQHASKEQPDYALIASLSRALSLPVIAEGRIWEAAQARQAMAAGAFAVCVGSAITRPQLITRRFVAAIQNRA